MTPGLVVRDASIPKCGAEAPHVFQPGPASASPPYRPADDQRCECGAVTWSEAVEERSRTRAVSD